MSNEPLSFITNASTFKIQEKRPAVILLHGYGSDEHDLFSIANELAPGFIAFSVRAPRAIDGGGRAWFSFDILPGNKMVYDYKEAAAARKQLVDLIHLVKKRKDCDSSRVFIIGFSQGAIMGYDVLVAEPGIVKGLVALSGGMMDETGKALQKPAGEPVHVFIGHGSFDDVIAVRDGKKAEATLSGNPAFKVVYKEYPAAHTITDAEMADIRNWFKSLR